MCSLFITMFERCLDYSVESFCNHKTIRAAIYSPSPCAQSVVVKFWIFLPIFNFFLCFLEGPLRLEDTPPTSLPDPGASSASPPSPPPLFDPEELEPDLCQAGFPKKTLVFKRNLLLERRVWCSLHLLFGTGSVSNPYQLDPDPGFIRNPDPVPD